MPYADVIFRKRPGLILALAGFVVPKLNFIAGIVAMVNNGQRDAIGQKQDSLIHAAKAGSEGERMLDRAGYGVANKQLSLGFPDDHKRLVIRRKLFNPPVG